MIRLISTMGGLFNCVLLILLIGLFRGLDEGINEGAGFSIAGETGNQFLVRCYTVVGISLVVFVIGSFIKNKYISVPLRFSSLIFTLFIFWRIAAQKSYVYNDLHFANSVLNESLRYDFAVVSITLLLLCLQCVELVYAKPKVKELPQER